MKANGPMSRSALVTTRWSKTKPPLSPPATSRSEGSQRLQVGVGEHLLGAVLRRHRRRDPEPERVEVAVERVGLALGRLAAARAGDVDEVGALGERVALAGRLDVARQDDRQVLAGTGTGPQSSQWTTGIGVPQERWREIEKSVAR